MQLQYSAVGTYSRLIQQFESMGQTLKKLHKDETNPDRFLPQSNLFSIYYQLSVFTWK